MQKDEEPEWPVKLNKEMNTENNIYCNRKHSLRKKTKRWSNKKEYIIYQSDKSLRQRQSRVMKKNPLKQLDQNLDLLFVSHMIPLCIVKVYSVGCDMLADTENLSGYKHCRL